MAWADDRDGSAGYVTVTVLASAVDEAVPFFVVSGSDLPLDFHDAMSGASDTDGKTIRLSTSDGATQLACVPVGVDIGTDTFTLFCLGTGMSASVDVDYRIYVGNASLTMPTASGGMGEQAVFADYVGAYMPGVDTRDFTVGGRTLVASATAPGTATGSMEGVLAATYSSASSQYHKYEGTQGVSGWPLHIDASIYTTSLTSNRTALGLSLASSATNYVNILKLSDNTLYGSVIGNGGSAASASMAAVSSSTHYYAAINRDTDAGDTYGYFDGTQYTSATNVNTPTAFDRFSIGAQIYNSSVGLFWTGGVTIVLLSDSVRSANYVTTMVDNLAGTLYSVGTWTPALSTGWMLLQSAADLGGGDMAWTDPTLALTVDADYASAVIQELEYTNVLHLYNPDYPSAVPPSVEYTVYAKIINAGVGGGQIIEDEGVYLAVSGTAISSNLAVATAWGSADETEYGPTWGVTWEQSHFDENLGVLIQGYNSGDNNGTARLVTVWLKVDWDAEAPAETDFGSFFQAFATFGSVV